MAPRHIRVVAAVVQQNDRYLITQRRPSAILPLLWEFPGGRVEPGETDAQALSREVYHRLQVTVSVGVLMSYVCHKYDKYVVDLHLYQCDIQSGSPANANVNDHAWVRSGQYRLFEYLSMEKPVISTRLDELRHVDTGFLYYAANAVEVAAEVRQILGDPQTAASRVKAGHELVVRSYEWTAIARRFEGLVAAQMQPGT